MKWLKIFYLSCRLMMYSFTDLVTTGSILGSFIFGTIYVLDKCLISTKSAIDFETAIKISSLKFLILKSNKALNIAGKTTALFIWFGKSERPVATIAAPALIACAGNISGSGLLRAKIIGSLFILFIILEFSKPPFPDVPIKTSAPSIAVTISPFIFCLFEFNAISFLNGLI